MNSSDNPRSNSSGDPTKISGPALPRIRIVRDGILAFAGVLALAFVLLRVGQLTGLMHVEQLSLTPVWIIGLLLPGELLLVGAGIFLRRRYRNQGHVLPLLCEGDFAPAIVVGIGSGFALLIVGVIIADLATKAFGRASTEYNDEIIQALYSLKSNPLTLSVVVLTVAVVGPICEEFFFRAALFNSVRSSKQAWAGAIVSSVVFALAHVNPMLMAYYLIVGLTMCWLFSKTRTMAAPLAAHMTINSMVCLAALTASQRPVP